jgi:hypothetical protein
VQKFARFVAGSHLVGRFSPSFLGSPSGLHADVETNVGVIRVQTFGDRTNFTDVYGDLLSRWDQEVWVSNSWLFFISAPVMSASSDEILFRFWHSTIVSS